MIERLWSSLEHRGRLKEERGEYVHWRGELRYMVNSEIEGFCITEETVEQLNLSLMACEGVERVGRKRKRKKQFEDDAERVGKERRRMRATHEGSIWCAASGITYGKQEDGEDAVYQRHL